jgi:hypothetical protein
VPPRREEDFLLHIIGFPVYVIPPRLWDGVVGLSGHSGTGSNAAYQVDQIRFYYLDRVDEPSRGLEIANVSSSEEARLESIRDGTSRTKICTLRPVTWNG